MDINNIKDQVSNLTLYDIKAGFRKAQNAVMNYTEMEAKVREATNNEPWGSSSTMQQEIANGTFNYQTLNEIMPMIYRRFTEKAAEEWRQIYKALQLLEYLIKHGSERVIDDARGHITLLKMLRQFHYIDQNGKDQGINVRNRAKELAELLGDVDKIRSERKKARANKAKYTGVEGGGGMSGFSSGSGRFGGFGSESGGFGGAPGGGYGGYSGGVYGDGGGFGGQQDEWRDAGASSSRADRFEEYDEGDDAPASSSRTRRPERSERMGVKKTTPAPAPKKKEPEVDLFSFDDPEPTPAAPAAVPAPAASSAMASLANNDDDDFDDFQSATPAAPAAAPGMVTSNAATTAQFAAPKPMAAPQQQQANITDMMSSLSPPASANATPAANYSAFSTPMQANPMQAQAQQPKLGGFQSAQPNYYQSVQVQPTGGSMSAFSGMSSNTMTPSSASTPSAGMSALNKPAAPATGKPAAASGGADPFANLWGAAGGAKKSTPTSGPKMGDLAKQKTNASLWGAPAGGAAKPAASSQPPASSGNGLDDLLG